MPDLPVVGKVPKGWLIVVGGSALIVLGYVYYKHRSGGSLLGSSSTPAATDSSGYDPNAIDPATGLTYGQEQAGGYGSYGGASGGYYAGGGSLGISPPVPGSGGFVTNGQWAQQAETDLGGIGVDMTTLAAALGKYLTGQPVTTDQASLVDQAIALEGYPPVAGPKGSPPAIMTQASSSSGGAGGTSGSSGGVTGGSTGKGKTPGAGNAATISRIFAQQGVPGPPPGYSTSQIANFGGLNAYANGTKATDVWMTDGSGWRYDSGPPPGGGTKKIRRNAAEGGGFFTETGPGWNQISGPGTNKNPYYGNTLTWK